jgi:hypothetical protein
MRRAELRTFQWRCGAGKRTRRRSCTGAQTSCRSSSGPSDERERSVRGDPERPTAANKYSTGSNRHDLFNCVDGSARSSHLASVYAALSSAAQHHRDATADAEIQRQHTRPAHSRAPIHAPHDAPIAEGSRLPPPRAAVLAIVSSGLVLPPSLGSSAARLHTRHLPRLHRLSRISTGRSSSPTGLPTRDAIDGMLTGCLCEKQ